ncbi:hypothetical protein BT69DRAFT_532081 [Atractiella rhizophila]|nr:hypothetical protein BT69DRAFT_532081 [Atractiella rhizophila]
MRRMWVISKRSEFGCIYRHQFCPLNFSYYILYDVKPIFESSIPILSRRSLPEANTSNARMEKCTEPLWSPYRNLDRTCKGKR